MAFKPFEFFRKREKLLAAVLTLVAMFLFIIGDPLQMNAGQGGRGGGCGDRFGRLIGQGEFVADVEGDKLSEQDIHNLHAKWLGTYRYLLMVEETGADRVLTDLGITEPEQVYLIKLTKEFSGQPLSLVLQHLQLILRDIMQRQGAPLDQNMQARVNAIQQKVEKAVAEDKDRLSNLSISPQNLPYELLRTMRIQSRRGDDQKLDMYLERQFYLRRAKEMGIVVSADRLKEDLGKLGYTYLSDKELQDTAQNRAIQGSGLKDRSAVLAFMSEEARVMIARGLLQDRDTSGRRSVQPTPFEVWQAYVKALTELDVAVIPFTIENTGVVTTLNQEPTEEALEALFQKYRTELADPASPTPGFRFPEKFRLEFLLADLSENSASGKYYQRAVEAQLLLDPMAAAQEIKEVMETYLRDRETKYKRVTTFAIVPGGEPGKASRYELRLATGRMDDKATVAAVQGHFMAAVANTHFLPSLGLEAAMQMTARTTTHEGLQQAAMLLNGVGSAIDPSLAVALGTVAQAYVGLTPAFPVVNGQTQEYDSFDQVFPELRKKAQERSRGELAHKDLSKLQEDLRKYAKEHRTAYERWRKITRANKGPFQPPQFRGQPVTKALESYAQERGLTLGSMNQTVPQQAVFGTPITLITQDEKLAGRTEKSINTILGPIVQGESNPLVMHLMGRDQQLSQQIISSIRSGGSIDDVVPDAMSRVFLQRDAHGQIPSGLVSGGDLAPYEPDLVMASFSGTQQVLFWKTEQTPARTPETLDECRDIVRSAWINQTLRPRVEQAAKKKAEELVPQIKAALERAKVAEAAVEQARSQQGKARLQGDAGRAEVDRLERVVSDEKAKQVEAVSAVDKLLGQLPGMRDHVKLMRFKEMFPGGPYLQPATLPIVKDPQANAGRAFWQRLAAQLTPEGVLVHPPDDFLEETLKNLHKPCDYVVIANKPQSTYYLVLLRERTQPLLPKDDPKNENTFEPQQLKALGDWYTFNHRIHNLQIIGSPMELRMGGGGTSLQDYALAEKLRKQQEEWREFLRKRSKYDNKNAERLAEDLKRQVSDFSGRGE